MSDAITAFAAFIDITEDTQITELEEYLDARGVEIEVNESDAESDRRIRRIVNKCAQIFSNPATPPQELESLLFSVVSLLHLVENNTVQLLQSICDLVTTGANEDNAHHRLKILGLMLCQFEKKDLMALVVLKHELIFSEKYDIGHLVTLTLPTLKKWMDSWKLSVDDRRSVFILYWNVIKSTSKQKNPTFYSVCIDTLIEILSLPSSVTEEEATDLAEQLIVLALNDPSKYFFSNILQLGAVQNLKSKDERLYELLKVFNEGKMSSFTSYSETNKLFMEDKLGLDHCICERKMQLLTLVSLCVESKEVQFSTLTEQLQLSTSKVEQLIIDGIRQNLLKARIDHVNKKVIVMSCVHRTFDQEQWQLIFNRLSSWKNNISALRGNLKTLHSIPV